MALPAILQQYLNLPEADAPAGGKLPQGKNIYKMQGEKLKSRMYLMMHRKQSARIPLSNKPDPFQKQVPFVSDHSAGWNQVNNGFMRGTHI
jgi:hypothetical protein